MKKFIYLIMLICMVGLVSGAYYVTDPNQCPVSYQSQTCSGSDVVCGYSGGVTFCYDPSSITSPNVNVTTSTTNYACQDTACDGGFVIDCYYYDGTAPHCDNGNTGFCDRNSTCYNKHVNTNCIEDTFVNSDCTGTCISGYFQCDGSSTDADGCEIQTGSSCGSGTGTVASGECYSVSAGNCTSATRLDCNDDDGDSNTETCNGADGCEILIGGSCSVGSLSGTYSSVCTGSSGTCVVSKSYFETGTLIEYLTNSSQSAMLWFKNYGTQATINTTDVNNVSFIVNTSGVYWNNSQVGTGSGINYTHLSNFTDDLNYSDKNTNSSNYWDNLDSINATQMENSGGVLNILESWLKSLFYTKSETDNNLSLRLLITDQRYNETSYIDSVNTTANINSLNVDADTLDNYDSSAFFPINKSHSGTFNINGTLNFGDGFTNDGVTINDNGDIMAQILYVYQIYATSVLNLIVNNSIIPNSLVDGLVDLGNTTNRIGSIYYTGNITNMGTKNFTIYQNATSLYLSNGSISNDLFATDQDVPYGTISAFYLSECPAGWTLADGTDGTPDLRGIFIRGSGTSGVLKDANGNYISAGYGEYYNDSFQGHYHSVDDQDFFTGSDVLTNRMIDGGANADNSETGSPITDGTHGTPRTANETRPFSYNTIYCMKISNQEILQATVETYDTGWLHIYNNDWTNVYLGSLNTSSSGNVTHNLNASLAELDVKILVSTDGTDDNSFEVSHHTLYNYNAGSAVAFGVQVYQVDENTILIQTGDSGVNYINTATGAALAVDTESWYYRVVVEKTPETVNAELGDLTVNGNLNVQGNITNTSANTYIDVPRKNYDTGWVACSDWTNQHLGDSVGGNVNHALGSPLSDILVKVLISTDGTDNNSFEIRDTEHDRPSAMGITIFQVDSNNITIQTGAAGIQYITTSTGGSLVIDTESWYYKVKVYKLG